MLCSSCNRCNDDLVYNLQYELSIYALSLCNDCGMRNTKKSALYQIFEQTHEIIDLEQQTLLVHVGFLLHKVVWDKGSAIQDICNTCIKYVKKQHCGKSCKTAFDRYIDTTNSIKIADQNSMSLVKTSTDTHFEEHIVIGVPQSDFLSNKKKAKLTHPLIYKLNYKVVLCQQILNDVNTLIFQTAIDAL